MSISNTTYAINIDGTQFRVVEFTRDFSVTYEDDAPSKLEIWRGRRYYVGDNLVKTDPAFATRIPLSEVPAKEFGSSGLSVLTATEVLGLIAALGVQLPAEAQDVTAPVPPDGVGAALDAAQARLDAAKAELDQINADIAKAYKDQSVIDEQIRSTGADLATIQRNVTIFGEKFDQIKHDMDAELLLLETQKAELQQTIIDLNAKVADKSAEVSEMSTALQDCADRLQAIAGKHNATFGQSDPQS